MNDLELLRKEIEKVDSELIKLMIRRNDIAEMIGKRKSELGIGLRNNDIEDKVVERYKSMSQNSSLPQDVSEAVCRLLINSSVELQSSIVKRKCLKTVTIIGGNGKMGRWMRRYFENIGSNVNVVDVSEGKLEDAKDSDIILISVPISSVRSILKEIDTICKKDALIFDISSVKSPFLEDIKEMAERRKVCSVHPMFGPSAVTMLNRNIVICNCGSEEAVSEAAELFGDMGADIIITTIERHDELVAYVLSFSHASNIVFFTVLKESGIPFHELNNAGSTTFRECLRACVSIAEEDPSLYHEIQCLNNNDEKMWDVYEKVVAKVKNASLSKDPSHFTQLMRNGKEYLNTGKFLELETI